MKTKIIILLINLATSKRRMIMKTNQLILLFFVIILVQSCTSWEDELTKKRTPYAGNEFRIDGCYSNPNSNGSCEYLFFYSNGVLLWLNDNCDLISSNQFKPLSPNLRMYWSIFQVEGKIITRTQWVESNLFSMSTSNRYYQIENDTTLLYTYNNNNFYYHFKKFNSKPDSTNLFIK